MEGIVIISRPILGDQPGFLVIETNDKIVKFPLAKDELISFEINDPAAKHCVGWYDITTHENHICESKALVDEKYESCYACRQKTGFNPAFYNTSEISDVQKTYNDSPHSVYISYFGNGLAKAGIMSDSRGLERIYEQGALLYAIVKNCSSANEARKIEEVLIGGGLRNSVTKKQKEVALTEPLNIEKETAKFEETLKAFELAKDLKIISCLDDYFYSEYIDDHITPSNDLLSGKIVGQVGRYLVVKNKERYYGYWLPNLSGYAVKISKEVSEIAAEPLQASLFSDSLLQ